MLKKFIKGFTQFVLLALILEFVTTLGQHLMSGIDRTTLYYTVAGAFLGGGMWTILFEHW